MIEDATISSEPKNVNITFKNCQGNEVRTNLISTSYSDVEMEKILYRLTITDFTTESAILKESEDKYKMMFNNMIHAFALHEMIYDAGGIAIDYRFLDVNPAFERLTGLCASDIVGKTLLERLPNSESYLIEEYGKVAKIKESEAKYRTLFDFIPFGISLSNKQGNLLNNNKEAIHLLGLTPKDLKDSKIGGDNWAIIRPDGSIMPAEEFAIIIALKENRRVENVVMGLIKQNKSITWITVTTELFNFGDYGVVIAYLDTTNRINAEKALKESELKFKSSFDFAGIFLGIIDLCRSGKTYYRLFR